MQPCPQCPCCYWHWWIVGSQARSPSRASVQLRPAWRSRPEMFEQCQLPEAAASISSGVLCCFLFQILDLESQSKSTSHIELSYSLPVFPSCSLTIFNSLTISYNLTLWGVQPLSQVKLKWHQQSRKRHSRHQVAAR